MNNFNTNKSNPTKSKFPAAKSQGSRPKFSKTVNAKTITDTKFTFLKKDYEGATVYIGNLNYQKDEIAVRNLFKKYGKVVRVKLVRDPKTNLKKGFGFAQMPNKEDAAKAIKELNGMQLDGRTLKVSMANNKNIRN